MWKMEVYVSFAERWTLFGPRRRRRSGCPVGLSWSSLSLPWYTYNLSHIQPFTHTTFHTYNLSHIQPFTHTTFHTSNLSHKHFHTYNLSHIQPFTHTTFHTYNLSHIQPFTHTTLHTYNLSHIQPFTHTTNFYRKKTYSRTEGRKWKVTVPLDLYCRPMNSLIVSSGVLRNTGIIWFHFILPTLFRKKNYNFIFCQTWRS
jgi:hypothetical protein